ncbi:MAG: DEAD/DEAH box helicase family protein [Pseudomonadota bacterium]
MSTSQFHFLSTEWPDIFESAAKVEDLALSDPRTACFYARRSLELTVAWLYKHDPALTLPYQDHLSALIHEPTFRNLVGPAVFAKSRILKDLGNLAVHSNKTVRPFDSLAAIKELFHVLFWLTRTYSRGAKPVDGLTFDPGKLPKTTTSPSQTVDQLQKLENQLRERDEKLATLLSDKTKLNEELQRVRAEISAIKQANTALPDAHNYSEAETRDYFIDLLLKEAGWALDKPQDREYEVSGMPNQQEKGFVDYVLWGDDGKPLGLVEAKRSKRDPRNGQQQAKLYADCLEQQFSQRPVIFYSNGYEHWTWDDAFYPPRPVQGFYKKSELELLIQRRTARKLIKDAVINTAIVERFYQTRAIRRIGEAFEHDHDRKALVVMATGAGKTRTVIALVDVLMRCNWAKRILFLADRVALVNQAVNAFKRHLADSSPVNLVTEKDTEGRVYVSTYPTMLGLIDETRDGQRRFGVGHFDLVIIDEAHRSVYQKYRAIFEYFDSLLVGLTATPKEEVSHDTYLLFDLERGVPTDAYPLDAAVKDGYLVPPKAVSVPLRFQREGIDYEDLPEEEKEQWDTLEWEDGSPPDRVEAEAVNKWLFNTNTVDKALEHLMTRGLKVAGGDWLGKTILFAKNHAHAEFIAERFNINYPHYKGEFARVIDFQVEYAQSLIDSFSNSHKGPHIAISVDMLDTGIDVPEVLNLVFFKLVRSKTKFWQMVGRGTRLCPEIFGPGKNKEFFYIFDFCQNLEYFSQNPDSIDGNLNESLGKRLFKARLELIGELDQRAIKDGSTIEPVVKENPPAFGIPGTEQEVRREVAWLLWREVAAMNVDNFIVRAKRRLVEKYARIESWSILRSDSINELGHEVAGLPSELDPEDEEAKRFDYLLLNLQLAVLRSEPSFNRLRDQVKEIAGLLEEIATIPMVQQELALIQEIQTDEWWENVTTPMLEMVRKKLRSLIKLIEKQKGKVLFTDFEDEKGEGIEIELPGVGGPVGFERFRAKARAFLKAHENDMTILKLRMNRPLTPEDLEQLEKMLIESGVGKPEDVKKAKEESHGLGLFVRSLVGLDREAAKETLAVFMSGRTMTANQIEFVNMIVDHLTEYGCMDPELLYESPFIDFNPQDVDGVFDSPDVDALIAILAEVQQRAAA